jgi:tryptophan 2,3-dioxygenase
VEERARSFPFGPVLTHWHEQGRAAADPDLIRLIDLIRQSLSIHEPASIGSYSWFVDLWLPMLVDISRDECTYATYVGTDVLHDLTVAADRGNAAPYAVEEVLGVLLALLLRFESEHTDGSHLRTRRLWVIASALVQHRGRLLERETADALWPPARVPDARSEDEAVVQAARALADRALAATSPELPRFLGALVVPVTAEHDEIMFLRTLQLFETVFESILQSVLIARDALAAGDIERATDELAGAGTSLRRAMPFFRIIGTMTPERFAVIRVATTGASGLQSEAFKRIELASALQGPDRLDGPGYSETNVAAFVPELTGVPSIEEHVADILRRQPEQAPTRLLSAMDVLDRAWLQWKKTHWAIATRLIGKRPGTGGTDGSSYLRQHMSGPLFPLLHD